MECAEARPVAGVDYPRTYQQLQGWFPDDSACLDYLARLRWPAGFVCPACESGTLSREARPESRPARMWTESRVVGRAP